MNYDDPKVPYGARLFRWRLWRLCYSVFTFDTGPRFRKLFWRFYWDKGFPVKECYPRMGICERCKTGQMITRSWVWCEADPRGRQVWGCKQCFEMCAGG